MKTKKDIIGETKRMLTTHEINERAKKIKMCPCCDDRLKETTKGGWENQMYFYRCASGLCGFHTPLKSSQMVAEEAAVAVLTLYKKEVEE